MDSGTPPLHSRRPPARHLRQLSLAPGSPTASASFSPPAGRASPATPSALPLSRSISLSRSGRRTSSIGYGPSNPASPAALDRGTTSLDALRSPLRHASPRPEYREQEQVLGLGLALDPTDGPPDSRTPFGRPLPTPSSSSERDPRERDPLTLTEKYSDLLSFIAQKESKSLELREALASNEVELAKLKSQWQTIVNRVARGSSAAGPPSAASPSRTPEASPVSAPSNGTASLLAGLGNLTSLAGDFLGVSDDSSSASTSKDGSPRPPPSALVGSAPPPAPFRTSLEVFTSSARSALGALAEDFADPPPPPSVTSNPMARSHSSRSSSNKRSSIVSTSSSSKAGSFDSTSSSLFSSPPLADDLASWDFDEAGSLRRTSTSNSVEEASSRDSRSLMDDLAASNSGWGRRLGDLAAGLGGSEHVRSTKRATLSITSSLVTSFASLASPPPAPVNHPLSAPLGAPTSSPLSSRTRSRPSISSLASPSPAPLATKMTVLSSPSRPSSTTTLCPPASPSLIDFGDDSVSGPGALTPPRDSPGVGLRSPSRSRVASQETDEDWNW